MLSKRLAELVDLFFRLVAPETVQLLDPAFELFLPTVDTVEIVASQFTQRPFTFPENCFQLPCMRSQFMAMSFAIQIPLTLGDASGVPPCRVQKGRGLRLGGR